MSTFPTPSATRLAVEHELFLLGHRNLQAHVFGQAGLSLLVAMGAWSTVPHQRDIAWITGMLLFALLLQCTVWAFRARVAAPGPDAQTLRQWKWANFTVVSMAGFAWGSLGWLFVPDAQVNNLMVMTSFAGALAYSAVSNVYDLRAFYSSVGIATVVLLAKIPHAFGDQYPSVVGMCLLYMVVLSMVAHSAHKTLITSIELRLENEVLARAHAEQAARAEKANRDKSEFLAAASHDLRQPVHALLLLIEAYRHSHPEAAQHPLIQQIASAGRSVGALFNALMELSRLEGGGERVAAEAVRLADSLHAAVERVRPQADSKALQLRVFVARSARQGTALTDRVLLERILDNLLSNAVRYIERGGILVALRPAHGGDGLWLEVWDTGIGIAPQDQQRIFDPYTQVGNRERDRTKGLGLGLAIVRRATALLDIGVALQSRPRRGSCFRLHLPQAMLQQHPQPAAQALPPASSSQVSALAGHRILVIDDDPLVLHAMQALLASWRMEVRCADAGHPLALPMGAPVWAPECIISDFRLPGPLNGIALLDELLERFPGAVGILQTGELVQNVQAEAEEAGYLVLFKPVPPPVLARTLCALLDNGGQQPGGAPCIS